MNISQIFTLPSPRNTAINKKVVKIGKSQRSPSATTWQSPSCQLWAVRLEPRSWNGHGGRHSRRKLGWKGAAANVEEIWKSSFSN